MTSAPPSTSVKSLRRWLPWLCAGLIVIWLLFRIDLGDFWLALRQADLALYLPLILVFIAIWYLFESHNLWVLYRAFGHDLGYAEVLRMRGQTYLLMIVNYNLGVGAIALYLNRRHGMALARTASLMFYYVWIETLALTLLAVAGCLMLPITGLIGQVLFLGLGLLALEALGLGCLKLAAVKRLAATPRLRDFWQILHEADLATHLRIGAWRSLYFLTFIVFFYFGLHSFGIFIPFLNLAAYVPIIFFVGNLPITPAGLGTIQAAMLLFFQDYAGPARIMAFGMVYSVSLIILRLPIGFYCLKRHQS